MYIYIYLCINMCIYIYMYIHLCIDMYIHPNQESPFSHSKNSYQLHLHCIVPPVRGSFSGGSGGSGVPGFLAP